MILQMKRHWSFHLPFGIVAGGWIRDTLLGVTPRDLDIFVPYTDAWPLYEAMRTRMSFWKITPHLTVPGQSRHSVNPWTGLNTPTGLNNGYIHHVISMNIGRTWMG